MGFAERLGFWAPPDPTSARIGREGELLAAKVRCWAGAAGILLSLWDLALGKGLRWGNWIGLAYAALFVLLGLAARSLARVPAPPRWLGALTCAVDVSLVSALHLAMAIGGMPPQTVLNSTTAFSLYFMALAFTCVRQDVRLCALAGLIAVVQYGVLALWLGMLGTSTQVARVVLLAVVAAISAAIVRQSRSYVGELSRLVEERTRDLQQEKARAEAASQSKSEFLANMSHEIRTPLNAILGLTDLALRSPVAAEQRAQFETVKQSGEALLAVISDVLDMSKIEAGKLAVELAPFHLRGCIDEAVSLVAHKASAKGLAVHCHLDAALPAVVESDAGRLRQILANLLDNAVKFTVRGDIRLEVAASPVAEEGALELQFAVRDTGIGISAAALERLFKPFVQVDSSMSRLYGGSGLGLAISRRIAERLGGRLWVESEPGRGSAFFFTLRCRPASGLPAAAPAPEELADLAARFPWRILLAEDNSINQRVEQLMLARMGYQADLAGDGFAVLEAVRQQRYDLVLMDVQMPGMDGLEATRRLRSELPAERQPWIVAVTASVLEEQREACLAAGMDDFVGKPLRLSELGAALLRAAGQAPAAPLQPPPMVPEPPEDGLRLDLSRLADLSQLDDSGFLVREIVDNFLAETPRRLERMGQALERADAGNLAFVAHTLKGSSSQVGALRMVALSCELEAAGKRADLAAVPALLAELERELDRVASLLEARKTAAPLDPAGNGAVPAR